jgi:hypothetical protein
VSNFTPFHPNSVLDPATINTRFNALDAALVAAQARLAILQNDTVLEQDTILIQNIDDPQVVTTNWVRRGLNVKVSDAEGWVSIIHHRFTGGNVEPVFGDVMEGASSGATARVIDVVVDSGSFADGDAEGAIWVDQESGTFTSEDVDVPDAAAFATLAGEFGFRLDQVRVRAGKYRLRGSMTVAGNASGHNVPYKMRWISEDETIKLPGTSSSIGSSQDTDVALIRGVFEIDTNRTFELQARAKVSSLQAESEDFGESLLFNWVELRRI